MEDVAPQLPRRPRFLVSTGLLTSRSRDVLKCGCLMYRYMANSRLTLPWLVAKIMHRFRKLGQLIYRLWILHARWSKGES
jgi:hypothetical protein